MKQHFTYSKKRHSLCPQSRLFLMVLSFVFLSSLTLSAQVTVTGRVVDSKGETIPGVSVLELGTSNGMSTDIDGGYVLKVKSSATLRFAYTGYQTQDIAVNGRSSIDVVLIESDLSLSEVLVVGYGTMRKQDKTGAVASVTNAELQQGIMNSTVKALQGKAAGVQISKAGGDPNAGFSVKIRGQAGLSAGTDPLYVIDGVPGADPNSINPNDIESFNLLKDASSTAIYGSRGANGVIMITTKKGEGKGSFDISSNVSFDYVARRIDLISGDDYRAFANENFAGNWIDGGASTDWQDAIYQRGTTSVTNVAYGGSTEQSNYRISGTFNRFDGVIKNSQKNQGTMLFNGAHKTLNNHLTLEGGLAATIEQNNWVSYGGNGPRDVLYQAFQRNPTDPIRTSTGDYYETERAFQYYNPVSLIEQITDKRDYMSLRANLNLKFDIWNGIKAGVNGAYIINSGVNGYYIPSTVAAINASGNDRHGQKSQNGYNSKLLEVTLGYDKVVGKNSINAVLGYSFQEDQSDGFSAQGKGSQSDLLNINNLGVFTVVNPGDITSYMKMSRLISFFGRASYNYDSRYYATVTVRNDGSSKFGANNKWGLFPSGSIAWNIGNEAFMKSADVVSMLKIRVGYGLTGNQEIDPYLALNTMAITGTTVDPETGETVVVIQGNRNPNPNLKWEENSELNIGVDFGFWNDRLTGSVEFYDKTTNDLMAYYNVPTPPNAYGTTFANGGSIKNRGVELTVQAHIFREKNFSWRASLVASHNQQKLNKLSSENGEFGWENNRREGWLTGRGLVGAESWTQIIREGQALGTFFLPSFAGFSRDGKFLYHTAAGGVTRDITQAERVIAGCAQPKLEIGFSNYFTLFKNLDISFSLRAVIGHKVFNGTEMFFGNPWVLPSLNGTYTALDLYEQGINDNPAPSDRYLENGSFLRLDDITIGYSIPFKANKYIQKCRIYFTGNNLLTITGYKGLDPEVSYGGLTFGVENYNIYPRVRSFIVGVQFQF